MKESTLHSLADRRRLSTVERKRIDDHALRGYLLAVSSKLILLRQEYDFELDGYTIVRRQDVTRLARRAVDRSHERIESEEGLTDDKAIAHSIDITDWRSVLSSLRRVRCHVSLEHEPDPSYVYLVGRVMKASQKGVTMLGFDPLAKWHDESTTIAYSDITRVCFENRYITLLSKYTH